MSSVMSAPDNTSRRSRTSGSNEVAMRISPGDFRVRPLRVHTFLHDVPLEDAWAVPLSGGGAGRTIQDLRTGERYGGESR